MGYQRRGRRKVWCCRRMSELKDECRGLPKSGEKCRSVLVLVLVVLVLKEEVLPP